MTDFGILDTVLNNFTSAIASAWGPGLFAALQPLLFELIVLQLGLIALDAAIQRDVPLIIVNIFLGLVRIGVVWAIFTYGFDWANAIVQTGQVLGSDISGFALTPSGVFDAGLSMVQTIWSAKASAGWLSQIIQFFEFFFTAVVGTLSWSTASFIYLLTLIEAALLVYVAPLVVAFTPISWTFDLLLIWGRSLLGLAFKLALLVMTLAVGMTLAGQWATAIAASSTTFSTNIWNLLIFIVESLLFAYFVWKVPNRITGLTTGASVVGFGEALLGMAASGAGAAFGALGNGNSGGGGSGGGSTGGGNSGGTGGGGNAGGGNNGAAAGGQPGPSPQELAAKVQAALLKG